MKLWSSRNRVTRYAQSEWVVLFRELWQRLYRPVHQPSYVFFFIVSLAIGAMGIWVAIIEAWLAMQRESPSVTFWMDPRVFNSMLTYFAALGSLSCMQVIIVEDSQKHLRALVTVILVTFLSLAACAAVIEHYTPGEGIQLLIIVALLAMGSWWIANWDEKKFTQPRMTDPLGGDSDEPIAGSTEGYSL